MYLFVDPDRKKFFLCVQFLSNYANGDDDYLHEVLLQHWCMFLVLEAEFASFFQHSLLCPTTVALSEFADL